MTLDYLAGKKIKLTFEKSVYDRLQEDIFTFNVKNMSNLIECVVLAYCRDSAILKEIEKSINKSDAIHSLLANKNILFKKTLVSLAIEKGKTVRRVFKEEPKAYGWTVTVPAFNALNKDLRTENEPYSFIVKILEEFVSFTVAEKERIIMAKAIEEINMAIERQLPFEYVSKGGNIYVMHPNRIIVDPYLQYTYIVGNSVALENYNADTFEPNENNIKNIRLLNLRYNEKKRCWIKLRYGERLKTNHMAIESRLEDVSPAFVGETVYDVKALLNEWGEKTLKSILQNRPRCVSKGDEYVDGFKEYAFRCTLFQAEIYFINFDDSARIISPPEAVERIKTRIDALRRVYN